VQPQQTPFIGFRDLPPGTPTGPIVQMWTEAFGGDDFRLCDDLWLPGVGQYPPVDSGYPGSDTSAVLVKFSINLNDWVNQGDKSMKLPVKGDFTTVAGAADAGEVHWSGTITLSTNSCKRQAYGSTPSGSFAPGKWNLNYAVTPKDGLVLTDVSLLGRYMAAKMSLPYFKVSTKDGFSSDHCELHPDDKGVGPCNTTLVDFQQTDSALQAIYVAANIDQTAPLNTSCLVITERYEFTPIQTGCEPFLTLPCALVTPSVHYTFVPGDASKDLVMAQTAQRIQFQIDGEAANTATIISDHDPVFSGLDGDPMQHQQAVKVIENGQGVNYFIGGGLQIGSWDNYHQTSNPAGVQHPAFDLTSGRRGFGPLGCPECSHIHWIWFPGSGDAFGNGAPRIPAGSNQDVTIAALRAGGDDHPDTDFLEFFNPGDSILPTAPLSFWYVGMGHQRSDTFFTHGLGFSPCSREDVTGKVLLGKKGFSFVPSNNQIVQSFTLQNADGSPITDPMSVVIKSDDIVKILNQAGSTTCNLQNVPYVVVEPLPAGAPLLDGFIRFAGPNPIVWTPQIFSGGIP
jgi:hypothetical protein